MNATASDKRGPTFQDSSSATSWSRKTRRIGATSRSQPLLMRRPMTLYVATTLRVIRSGPNILPLFLYRALQSQAVNRQLQVSASGVTRYGLPNGAIGDVVLPLPPIDEQRAIGAFLDQETERFDSLVAKIRLLIERLSEYRTALITHTVTRGLPPGAARSAGVGPSPRLRPSGIEWLGEVPEHWQVKRLESHSAFAQRSDNTIEGR